MARILLVEDDGTQRRALLRTLSRLDHAVVAVGSAEEALTEVARARFDVLLSDVGLPGLSGIDLLSQLRQDGELLPVVMMSGARELQPAMDAVRLGALDFLQKPITRERLQVTVANAGRMARLERGARQRPGGGPLEQLLIGDTEPVARLRELIARVAPSDARVLILGENGTGKELVATSIHRASPRAEGPFVQVNCAAIPAPLVESELFGHRKGAFTGAQQSRRGRFELADGGTLLLDEVGDMPLDMQSKLLRVLQEGEVQPVGADSPRSVDVRVLAATNRSLEEMIEAGTFREDLYYRLAVVTLQVPPLRERREDVGRLVTHFQASQGRSWRLTPAARDLLAAQDWPGNVRELRNAIERVGILRQGEVVDAPELLALLGLERRREPRGTVAWRRGATFTELTHEAERAILRAALDAHSGNKSAAARSLSMERSQFHRKLKARGLI